ncbi:LysR family transcriptional regulator [Labrys monachus]|uniref:DNA-binding transcriptional LysR family regulator n=1 Tax=Labrys monachus TaxID=217067 RepID=A0ABU0FIL4_9HYPH|nr:LysR family transcriptional regulator [Labrys monachus]MDQ0394453.1 DNA-binding transcriptional LysR family regulator [Labrys monachus]
MARTDPFDGLSEFLAIARCGSFRRAAAELGVTPGAVSQALQGLEARLGLPLFHRTTRSVALTEAGERLLGQIGQPAETITASLDDLVQLGVKPAGTLRLLVHRIALPHVLEPVLPGFRQAYPDVKVEITVDDTHAPIVAGGYDAGIRIGEYIDRDMLAVRVTPPFAWVVLGAPGYFERRGRPYLPEDIARHDCIRYRRPDVGDVYRWEFQRDGQALSIEPPGGVEVNDAGLLRALARQGMGLAYTSSLQAQAELAEGTLEPVLQAFAPARDSLFICFPRASRRQPKLRAFVAACLRATR